MSSSFFSLKQWKEQAKPQVTPSHQLQGRNDDGRNETKAVPSHNASGRFPIPQGDVQRGYGGDTGNPNYEHWPNRQSQCDIIIADPMIFQLLKFALGRLSLYANRTKMPPVQFDIAQGTEEATAASTRDNRSFCRMKKATALIGGKNGLTGQSRRGFSKESRKSIKNNFRPAFGAYRPNRGICQGQRNLLLTSSAIKLKSPHRITSG
jgi:hypothetical protein